MAARSRASICLLLLLIGAFAGACGWQPSLSTATSEPTSLPPSATPPPPTAQVTFEVDLPDGTPTGQAIFVDILDEVTGLGLNPTRYQMERARPQHYSVSVPVVAGSLVKYRFTRGTRPSYIEYNCLGQQVRYRMLSVTGSDTTRDVVCQWNDLQVAGIRGRITGQVTDAKTGQPLPNIQVQAGGVTTLTASDGSYLLEGLPPGTHTVIAASLNGEYLPYQQGAVIAEDATTPAPLALQPAQTVQVRFRVHMPPGDDPDLPVYVVGNISALGNTFADLAGGVSVVAYRAAQMERGPNGHFSLDLSLPAGLDLRYKYTRGDGFWNAEMTSTGGFMTRQIIIPDRDAIVEDTIAAWTVQDHAPITFDLSTPANTPVGDTVSIQFSAFGWTEPIPMWKAGENAWRFTLQNPLHLMDTLQYRFCRNNLCSAADDLASMGASAQGQSVAVAAEPQTIVTSVKDWAWWSGAVAPVKIQPGDSGLREDPIQAGVEMQPNYFPAWDQTYRRAYEDLAAEGLTWVFLTPTWHYSQNNPPVLEPQPGKSPLWTDVQAEAVKAGASGLRVAVFPRSIHTQDDETWWLEARRDGDWWTRWFERYSIFVLSHADLAEQTGADALVLGEPGIEPALPGGTLRDGTPSGVPDEAAQRWDDLIAAVREHFRGELIWAVSYPGGLKTPGFVSQFDRLYVLWSAPLAETHDPKFDDLTAEFSRRVSKDIRPLQEGLSKPVLIGLAYPSTDGGVLGCLKRNDSCRPFSYFDSPNPDDPAYKLDLAEQRDVYRAALEVIGLPDNAWISGLISRGYYPAAALQDKSSSIHGKPAEAFFSGWLEAAAEAGKPD